MNVKNQVITEESLKKHIHYNPETGIFIWLRPTSNRVKVGSIAGCSDVRKRVLIRIGGELYLAHRLAWLYVHGEFPSGVIDHINNDPSDNRLSNLRVCAQMNNSWNSRKRKDNTSGHKGIHFDKSRNKWAVRIMAQGVLKCIGRFQDLADAVPAMTNERKKLHGDYCKV